MFWRCTYTSRKSTLSRRSKVSRSKLSKVRERTERQTDATELITRPHSRLVELCVKHWCDCVHIRWAGRRGWVECVQLVAAMMIAGERVEACRPRMVNEETACQPARSHFYWHLNKISDNVYVLSWAGTVSRAWRRMRWACWRLGRTVHSVFSLIKQYDVTLWEKNEGDTLASTCDSCAYSFCVVLNQRWVTRKTYRSSYTSDKRRSRLRLSVSLQTAQMSQEKPREVLYCFVRGLRNPSWWILKIHVIHEF